jgi:hypothetical protein
MARARTTPARLLVSQTPILAWPSTAAVATISAGCEAPSRSVKFVRAPTSAKSSARSAALQGTRDALADMTLLVQTINTLGAKATLAEVSGADHSFHVPARSRRTDTEVLTDMLDTLSVWITTTFGVYSIKSNKH